MAKFKRVWTSCTLGTITCTLGTITCTLGTITCTLGTVLTYKCLFKIEIFKLPTAKSFESF